MVTAEVDFLLPSETPTTAFDSSSKKAMAPAALISKYYDATEKAASRALIEQALRSRIETIDHDECDAGGEDAFFVADLGEVYRQHLRWKLNLPRVEPFYG